MRIVATIEARMRSSRLPGKVLLPVLGRPMLELMIERLRKVPQLDAICIATTEDASCDPIVELAGRIGVGCYRGSEDDVLDRVLQAARWMQADLIVETTGDCPLIDPATTSRVIETFLSNDVDYCSNVLDGLYLQGTDVQVFPFTVLEEVSRLTDDPTDREHVSIYIYEHPELFRLLNLPTNLPPEAADLRLTVDTPEDFKLIQLIYEALYPTNPHFGINDILELFRQQPHLASVNAHIEQKAVR